MSVARCLRRLVPVGFIVCLSLSAADAQGTAPPPNGSRVQKAVQVQTSGPAKPRKATKAVPVQAEQKYFIEFRSRYALSYGHTFLAHGRLNSQGEIMDFEVAGLHPKGDDPTPWMIGHIVPVASETGPSDGDLEEKYISARYRIVLNEAEYAKVVAYIRKRQAETPLWHAVFNNCNSFVGDIASFMGLKIPTSSLLYPAHYINTLRELNGG